MPEHRIHDAAVIGDAKALEDAIKAEPDRVNEAFYGSLFLFSFTLLSSII